MMKEIKVFAVCEDDGGPSYQLRSAADARGAIREVFDSLDREAFYLFVMDARNRIVARHLVSLGSLTGSIVHPREVFKAVVADPAPEQYGGDVGRIVFQQAIRNNAAAVLFAHNHPSGDPTPSPEDIQITKQLVEAGKILGIKVLDHIIVGENRNFSFEEEELL